ncbi:MAG TPA: NAD(P)H-quinone oxidoreductase [Gemmatimonadales bacterium]|nr:NAD(P)H-quinone oxidoreductase [Gemmatimonadales bacterium]
MRAITYVGAGGVEVIGMAERPVPEPGAGQVRVRVRAAGLNRADILQRRGGYPAPAGWPADIPGLEFAGEVETLGAGVSAWRVGDRVMGLVGGGAHAEAVVVNAAELLGVPAALDWDQAAAIPEAFLTAWDALLVRGRLRAGERALIHAAGSGVGTAAIQVAKLAGAQVIGTSRQAAKLERLREFGLDQGIDTSAGDFSEQVGAGVDVVLDVLGGPVFAQNLAALRQGGRLVLLGFLGGSKFEGDLSPILRKRLAVIGTVMRTRGPEERAALAATWAREILPAFERGGLRPVVGAVVPMAEVARAHALMEGNELFGKCVLRW